MMKPTNEMKVSAKIITSEPEATEKEILIETEINVKADLSLQDIVKKDVKGTPVESKKESTSNKKVFYKHVAVQTNREEKIKLKLEDLTSDVSPCENYWEIIAEKRRLALSYALEENKELHERLEQLEKENLLYKEMQRESNAMIEVLQEMIGDDRGDIQNSLEDSVI